MPHGENDEGASEFEFRGVSSHVVSRESSLPGGNLANMYQNAKMYMPARQGSLQPFSSPMGQDVQRFKSVGKRRVDSKTNALALSPEQTQKQLEIQKMEAWMKEHGKDDLSSSSSQEKNLRGTTSTSTTDSGEQKEGAPLNTTWWTPEPGRRKEVRCVLY